ncbi:GAF domain-containing protein [Pontibacter mangrovi]|uniref:GAF domain-containing protein n=1 Tax=Pontibacter mangrovi TaxID=2589816 RepID=A0A501W238_9BACT|nr:GAF domain-containing protein [Pontibacter mangrovi]TPE42812.1 GAF domain-containing protein [Pontibacter mangrovi]
MSQQTAPVNIKIEKNYDSEMCGSIPLHLVNLIQPHGVLLVLDKKELRILQASENVGAFLPATPEQLLQEPLSRFLPAAQYEEIQNKLEGTLERIPLTLQFEVDGKKTAFSALVLPQEEYVLLELEERQETAQDSFIGLYQNIKYITSLLKQASTYQGIAQQAAEGLKKLSGFDRVMIYQFDPHWNGIVVAQAKEEDMDDYMDLRFPASDVPKQARELYFRNPYRIIPTHNYEPVRLQPVINPLTQRFTDLSESNLRSVAKVHLEYLSNMNITASMSLPIIIDNKLWGLISCHHKTAKYPSYEMRSAMELLSGILSAQLEAKQKEESMALRVYLRGLHVNLMEQLFSAATFAEGLQEGSENLINLLSLGGTAVVYEGNVLKTGITPEEREIKELVSWLRRNKARSIFATDALPAEYPHSKAFSQVASGLIAIPVNPEQGEFILGFRPEVLQTIKWGGNPNNAIQMEPDGKNYHPRNSFATYQETVKQTSLPWRQEEYEAAEALRNAVLEKIIREKY